MTTNTFYLLEDRALLSISGADSREFLQGLISNDVDKISATAEGGRAIYAALLTAQGKYLHDFFVFAPGPGDDSLVLDCEKARIDDLLRRLRMYRLRAKVEFEILDDWAVVAITGDARPALARGVIYDDPRHEALGARAALKLGDMEGLGLTMGAREDYDTLRLTHGIPASGSDLIAEKSLLMESGFEELNGVDFEKGCYVGQEVTARMKHKTELRKGLARVRIEGEAAPGTPIMAGEKEVGTLHTVSGGRALAYLRFDRAEGEMQAGKATVTLDQAR